MANKRIVSSFNQSFTKATTPAPDIDDTTKTIIDTLQDIAHAIDAGKTFVARLTTGISSNGGNVLSLIIVHRETHIREAFFIDFDRQQGGDPSVQLSTTHARVPFGALAAQGGYCIQHHADRDRLLSEMGAHMGAKVNAQILRKKAAQYVVSRPE